MKLNTKAVTRKSYLEAGILIIGDVYRTGCVSYKIDEMVEKRKGAMLQADWHTAKTITDVDEQKAVSALWWTLRYRLRKLGACVAGIGYMIPATKVPEADELLKTIEQEIDKYNAGAKYTRLTGDFLQFEIVPSDNRTALALYRKIIETFEELAEAVKSGDVTALRAALKKAKGMDTLLPVEDAKMINKALNEAREAAKTAIKDARGLNEEEAVQAMKKALKTTTIDKVRASVIEQANEIGAALGRAPHLTRVDARQIE
jgi:hypothetical protein